MSKPKVVKGDHLTVTTFPSGEIKLEWDWDALSREIAAAMQSYESGNWQPPKAEIPKKKPVAKRSKTK